MLFLCHCFDFVNKITEPVWDISCQPLPICTEKTKTRINTNTFIYGFGINRGVQISIEVYVIKKNFLC